MKTFSRVFAAAVVLGAAAASAQTYTIQSQSQPYQPLTGGTPVTLTARSTFGADDEGFASVPLGFSFPFYGNTYTSVHVDSNGFLYFGSTPVCTAGFTCYTPGTIPNATRSTSGGPHNVIAPWWGDLEGPTGTVRTVTSPGEIAIEWSNWSNYGDDYKFSVTVRLNASGMINVHYGTAAGLAPLFGGTMANGFENSTGTLGNSLTMCGAAQDCELADWPTNTLFTIGTPVQPDITVPEVNIANLVKDMSNNFTFTVTPTFRNFGQNPTGDFVWKAYLSTDRVLSPATDILVFTATAPVNLTGTSGATPTAAPSGNAATTVPPPVGQYYVIVEADTASNPDGGATGGQVTEASENNNVGSTTNFFVQGLDLVATQVSGPAQSGPGNPIQLNVRYFNQGTDNAGTVNYRVLLSTDATFSSNDFVLYTGTRMLTGGETVNENVSFNVPGNVPGGDFFYLLQIDPANAITEANENNNVIASGAKVTMKQADLVNEATDWIDPLTAASTRIGYFGSAARATVKATNSGGANATNFKVGVVVSQDSTLSLLSDTIVHEKDVALLANGTTQNIDVPFTLPANDKNNQPFATGQYYVFVVLDSSGAVTELNEGNNILVVMGPVTLRAPAPDLSVSRVDVPATGAVGEAIPVQRTFRNIGNQDPATMMVKYRFFASANAIITPDDVPLPIVTGTTEKLEGTVALPIGAVDQQTEFVKLPATMPPGTYYVGAIVDFDNAVVENEESNNTLASNTVQVAPSSLRVTTTQLPDAVIDRPYAFRLSVQGEQGGGTTWKLDTAQGTLPAGLTLAADGLITGTPTEAKVASVTAIATNAGRDAAARLVLRVLPTTTQVEITTLTVPVVINQATVRYEFALGAAGGAKPYAWRLVSGGLPQNLALSADGVIAGNPRPGLTEGSSKVTVEVKDALGTSATRELTFRVVAPGSLGFCPTPASQCKGVTRVPDSLTGRDYGAEISVFNLDGSPLATPLKWTLSGQLPDGLSGTPQGQVYYLSGRPLKAGVYEFTATVEDARGRANSADFTIRVYPPRFNVSANGIPQILRPGDTVDFSITAATSLTARFTLYSGSLPPGVTLDSSGKVSGTVENENSEGNYNFVVEAKDDIGGSGLAAFNLVVQKEVKTGGCSVAGEPSSFGLWLLMLLAPFLYRRKLTGLRKAFAPLAIAALALAPVAANAQEIYEKIGPSPIVGGYTAVTGGTSVTSNTTINLPFAFNFFGTPETQVTFSQHGYLSFGAPGSFPTSNQGIPASFISSSYPARHIAPWWDNTFLHSGASFLVYRVYGTAPNRSIVFEWQNVSNSSTTTVSRFSYQAILFEGTSQIRFAYGPNAPSTSGSTSSTVGIQANPGSATANPPGKGISALSCTTASTGNCPASAFPANSAIDYFVLPDLVITSISADQVGYSDAAYRATAIVRNVGGRLANSVVNFYLSTNATFESGSDVLVGSTNATNFDANADTAANLTGLIPASTMPGTYFLLAQVDPQNAIVELLENNNLATPVQITIGQPTPDLVVNALTVPSTGMAGSSLSVSRNIANVGNAAAATFKYTWFLSDNSVVTISDRKLVTNEVMGGVAAKSASNGPDSVMLPSNLTAGRYWLGVCANFDPDAMPQFGIAEITQVNNCATAAAPTLISTGQLAIVTTTLPAATRYSPYGLRLQATGGDGQYTWSLSAGALPPGVTLNAQGDLQGTPAVAGTFGFDVKVSSGGADRTQTLSLMVADGSLPLAIVDQELPTAEFARTYTTSLVAVGGKPPYIWSLKDGRLPSGIALSTDGDLEGRASEGGEFTFSVELVDSAGTKASKGLKLKVASPTHLEIANNGLPTGYLRSSFLAELQAVGGRAPYTWALEKFQKFAESPTESNGTVGDRFPDNFGLAIEDGGNGKTYLRGTPRQAGLYALDLKVTDAVGAVDYKQLKLRVYYVDALAITTTALPDAFANHEYLAKLSHNGGKEVMAIFTVPCITQANKPDEFGCTATDSKNALPAGLTLGQDGTLGGTPLANAAEGGSPVVYTFFVKVVDDQGRQDMRSLSIKVRPDFANEQSGCSATGLTPSLLALLGAAALLRRRNRR